MKCCTRSCDRPSKRSASVRGPSSVSNTYSLSMRIQGRASRSLATLSRRWVSSFSAVRKFRRAFSHSSYETTVCCIVSLLRFGGGDVAAPQTAGKELQPRRNVKEAHQQVHHGHIVDRHEGRDGGAHHHGR